MVISLRLITALQEGQHNLAGLQRVASAEGETLMSIRSIRRYLQRIEQAGFPHMYDRLNDVYRFCDGFHASRISLTQDELVGIAALRTVAKGLGGKFADTVFTATEKVVTLAGARDQRDAARPNFAMKLPALELDQSTQEAYDALSAAERNRRTVQITYEDKHGHKSSRLFDTYGFIASSGRLYAVGHDHRSNAQRVFAIDNFIDQRTTSKSFAKPEDFNVNDFASASISGVFDGRPSPVYVHYDRVVAKAAVAAKLANPTIMRAYDNGSVDVEHAIANRAEFLRWLLQWGDSAEIIAPLELRTEASELLARMLHRYGARDVA
jgi:proteasome accessory factor B